MENYNSDLKQWGSDGVEFPDGYNYRKKEQPVAEWDNFVISNLINDTNALLDASVENFSTSGSQGSVPIAQSDGSISMGEISTSYYRRTSPDVAEAGTFWFQTYDPFSVNLNGDINSKIIVDGDKLYFATESHVYKVDIPSKSVVWSQRLRNCTAMCISKEGDLIAVGTRDAQYVYLFKDEGDYESEIFKVYNENGRIHPSILIHNGIVIAGGGYGSLKAYDQDGNVSWSYDLDSDSFDDLYIQGTDIIYHTDMGRTGSLQYDTGNENWTFSSGNSLCSAYDPSSKVLYVGDDPNLGAIDTTDGTSLWDISQYGTFNNIYVYGDDLYARSDSSLWKLNPDNGSKIWRETNIAQSNSQTSLQVRSGIAYFDDTSGNLHAFDVNSKNKLWTYNSSLSSPFSSDGFGDYESLLLFSESGTLDSQKELKNGSAFGYRISDGNSWRVF